MFPSIDDDTPIHYFRAGMRLVIQYRVLFGDDDYATIYLLTHSRQYKVGEILYYFFRIE